MFVESAIGQKVRQQTGEPTWKPCFAPNIAIMSKTKNTNSRIADNKKAAFNYFFEERFEAGVVLQGWEVKALR